MNAYTLSPLTRSANLQRRVVIQGFDLPVRGLTIAALALIPALPITIILWTFTGSYALVSIFVVEGAAFWLIESRTRNGLQLRRYQRFVDIRRSVSGTFTMCSRPIDPLEHLFGYTVSSGEPGDVQSRHPVLYRDEVASSKFRRMVRTRTPVKGSR